MNSEMTRSITRRTRLNEKLDKKVEQFAFENGMSICAAIEHLVIIGIVALKKAQISLPASSVEPKKAQEVRMHPRNICIEGDLFNKIPESFSSRSAFINQAIRDKLLALNEFAEDKEVSKNVA